MTEPDWTQKSFDFASDVTKQLITLATGVVTLTITFSKDILALAAGSGRGILTASWVSFLVSVIAGLTTLLSMTGQMGTANTSTHPSVYAGSVRVFSIFQILAFLVGIGFAIWYVLFALGQPITVPATASTL